jgi:hypothetical protein
LAFSEDTAADSDALAAEAAETIEEIEAAEASLDGFTAEREEKRDEETELAGTLQIS